MRSRFLGKTNAAALIAIAMTAGCTTPQHSNALIFGTNTSFGIDIGQSASGAPSLLVGYHRQEAVFMPLVANVAYDANGIPTPCNVYPRIFGGRGRVRLTGENADTVNLPPCFLVGQNGGAIDSYSVLASFGAQFSASSTNPSANGGLAQFFATGLAAQALAIRGGPALVAVGEAAEATGTTNTTGGIAALYNAPAVTARIAEVDTAGRTARDAVLDYLRNQTTDANFAQELQDLETAAGATGVVSYLLCDGMARTACLAEVGSETGRRTLTFNSGNWATAIQQRKQARGIP